MRNSHAFINEGRMKPRVSTSSVSSLESFHIYEPVTKSLYDGDYAKTSNCEYARANSC